MSATAPPRIAAPAGTSLRLRIAAVAVVVALAGLAAYTVFSGPTRVPLGGPAKVTPRTNVPPAHPGEPEGEGGEHD